MPSIVPAFLRVSSTNMAAAVAMKRRVSFAVALASLTSKLLPRLSELAVDLNLALQLLPA